MFLWELWKSMLAMAGNIVSVIGCLLSTGCSLENGGDSVFERITSRVEIQDDIDVEAAKMAFRALSFVQNDSVRENVEYCGYIIRNVSGEIQVVGPNKGERYRCKTPIVYEPNVILASFHSQGGFDAKARSEIPSVKDLDAAQKEKVDAYLGTPGGRFWHIESKTGVSTLICGPEKCLEADPLSKRHQSENVEKSLTREELIEIEAKG